MGRPNKQNTLLKISIFQKDGSKLTIRPILPTDSEIEWDFVHRLSAQSKYLRFMTGLKDLPPSMVRYFTNIDITKDMALIAVVNENGQERQIAVGRYFKYPDRPVCEFALVVADECHDKGSGTLIMKLLILDAKKKGYESMEGEILSTNTKMLQFVEHLGFTTKLDTDDARVTIATLVLKRA